MRGGASTTRNDPTPQLHGRHLQNSPANTGPKRILRGSRRSNFLLIAGPEIGGGSDRRVPRRLQIKYEPLTELAAVSGLGPDKEVAEWQRTPVVRLSCWRALKIDHQNGVMLTLPCARPQNAV